MKKSQIYPSSDPNYAIRNLAIFLLPAILIGCAPITPPPGLPSPVNMPSSPSSSSSMPSGMPSLPSPSSSSRSSPSKPSSSSSSSSSGKTSSDSSMPSGNPTLPSSASNDDNNPSSSSSDAKDRSNTPDEQGVFDPLAGETASEEQNDSNELSWEKTKPVSAASNEWETSNEQPLETSQSESKSNGRQQDSSDQKDKGKLQTTLDEFDKEILAERQVLKTTETPATESPLGEARQSVAINSQTGSNQAQPDFGGDSGGFQVNAQPIPSQKGTNPIPDDIPDARDDDIIARQLREAAMQEQDPLLKEKLWEEYKRYKRG